MSRNLEELKSKDLSKLFSLRIGNIPDEIGTEDILEEFKQFGEIGDFYRPWNLSKKKPSPFAFVRYVRKDDADDARESMHMRQFLYKRITVHDANFQDSYFTQDTGFITNELFDVPVVKVDNFDPSLPETHYTVKRQRELKYAESSYNVRVDDFPLNMSKEELESIFGEYGEICSIYYPVNLKNLESKGFAFVRFLRKEAAERAIQSLHGQVIGGGRPLRVQLEKSKTYFGQDESPYFK